MSYNPSLLQDRTNPTSSLLDFATGSEFTPYSTGVGLYDDDGSLLAVGKFGKPVPMSKKSEMNFVLKFDIGQISEKNYLSLANGTYKGVGYSDLKNRMASVFKQYSSCPPLKTTPIDPYSIPIKVTDSTVTC